MTVRRDPAPDAFLLAIEHTRSLSPATFDQWFASVAFDDLTDGVLTLRVQNEFVQEWVRDNFLPTLAGKLREITGHSIQIAWVLDSKLEHPIAVGDASAPIRPRALVSRAQVAMPPLMQAALASNAYGSSSPSTPPGNGHGAWSDDDVAPPSSRNRPAPLPVGVGPITLEDLNPKADLRELRRGAIESARPCRRHRGRRWRRTPVQPALHLRRNRPRQDPPHARDRSPNAERTGDRAHPLHLGRALHERVHHGDSTSQDG